MNCEHGVYICYDVLGSIAIVDYYSKKNVNVASTPLLEAINSIFSA